MRAVFVLAMGVLVTAACGKGGQEGARDGAAGSATDSSRAEPDAAVPAPADSLRDSSRAPAAGGATAGQAGTTAGGAPTIIGRDSAFGPSFTVDSLGNVVPIGPKPKKP